MNIKELEMLLRELRERRLVVVPDRYGRMRIWTPNTQTGVPRRLRSAVRLHRRELAELIKLSSVYACPSPSLHEWAFVYNPDKHLYCCPVCEQLNASIYSDAPVQVKKKSADAGLVFNHLAHVG